MKWIYTPQNSPKNGERRFRNFFAWSPFSIWCYGARFTYWLETVWVVEQYDAHPEVNDWKIIGLANYDRLRNRVVEA